MSMPMSTMSLSLKVEKKVYNNVLHFVLVAVCDLRFVSTDER